MQLPADAPLSDHLAVLFGQVSRTIARDRGPLSRADHTVLSLLDHAGPRRVCDLAEADGPDASTVSRRVTALAERGLIARAPDPDDRRAQLVALSGHGRTVLAAERLRRAELVADALSGWDDHDRTDLTRLLIRLSSSLGERAAASEGTPA